jgi:RNA-binding protein YhbY
MELEVRYHAYQEIKTSLRKAELIKKKWLRDQAEATDEIAKEMLQVDIDKNEYDLTIYKRKLIQAEREINAFLDVVKHFAKTEEDLRYYAEDNPDEERKYWIARMGKQAAIDVISYGRVGSGNMESISMMPEEDQLETLSLAMKYSGMVQAGIHNISLGVQSQIDKMLESKDERIPDIVKSAENIQLAGQPKINGTTVL